MLKRNFLYLNLYRYFLSLRRAWLYFFTPLRQVFIHMGAGAKHKDSVDLETVTVCHLQLH